MIKEPISKMNNSNNISLSNKRATVKDKHNKPAHRIGHNSTAAVVQDTNDLNVKNI